MNVMLLAAGEGTRLRPFTNTWPKPAIPFLNIPLAVHALDFLGDISVDNLVVNTFHLPQKIHSLFQSIPSRARHLHFSDEVGEILGSAGGLGKARNHFLGGGDFLMMNADEVILPEDKNVVSKVVTAHKSSGAIATLMVKDHPGVGTQFGGVWADATGKVLGFGKTAIPGAVKAWHFVGVQILSDKVFEFIPEFGASNILYDSLTQAMAKGHEVYVFPFECQWFETGNPHDFVTATQECFEILESCGYAQEALATRLERHRVSGKAYSIGHAQVLALKDADISGQATLSGFVTAGSDAKIPASAELHNVIVGPGVVVPEGTKAHNTLIL
jgi:Nucleoside-diphosphate-sugar pyrophosphorylase involved in lipopolysaccharide biosynthesis/translation initiation factor 2B, gamma/epsilon subunits (eIF-2Bgamma/eIF-2Bepsilon)